VLISQCKKTLRRVEFAPAAWLKVKLSERELADAHTKEP
jgi:hypothetical protein